MHSPSDTPRHRLRTAGRSSPPVALAIIALVLLSPGISRGAEGEIPSLPATITVDGGLSEWSERTFHEVTPADGVADPTTRPIDGKDDLSFRFAVAHDAEALYVAVEVRDDAEVADSCEPGAVSCPAWDDDAVEVFIDGNHNCATNSRVADGSELRFGGEFALVANGAANSDYSGYPKTFGKAWSGATNGTRVHSGNDTRMVYEFRLPWAVMGLDARPGTIGFTISVQDDDDGVRRDHALYWKGNLPAPFLDESGFGTVRFEDAPAPASATGR